jgi:hypothetical protein
MATVTVPGIGSVDQKYVYAGGALVLGVVGFAYWRRSQEPAAPTWADVDPSQMVPGTDHVTPGGSSNIPPVDLTGGKPTTNDQWAQAVTERLGNIGYTPLFVAEALGAFLARQELDALQAAAILAAKAQLGDPPVGGPWPVRLKGPTSPPPPGTGDPAPLAKLSNLHVTGTGRDWIALSWPPVPGAERYAVEVGGIAGVQHAGYDHVYGGTSYTIGGRVPGQQYTITVRAQRGDDNGPGLTIRARTQP